jgi:hypothetical protein
VTRPRPPATTHLGFHEVLAFDGGAAVEHPHGGPTLFFLRAGTMTPEPSQPALGSNGLVVQLVGWVDGRPY